MERALDISMEQAWGVDSDPSTRPGVPKEVNHENGASGRASHWRNISVQSPKVKIHKTVERPRLTAVYGTTCPPRGLSGVLRNLAYRRYSEDKLRHWFLLIFADRVDMVEGFFQDFFAGKAPAVVPRMEFRTGLKVRQGQKAPILFMAGAAALAVGVGIYLWRRR